MFFYATLAFLLTAGACGKSVQFKDCGSKGGILSAVVITPCNSEPCAFKRGDTIMQETDFVSKVSSTNATFQAFALIFGQQIPIAVPEPDACKLQNMNCPLKPGNKYAPAESNKIPSNIPPTFGIAIPVQFQIVGDGGLVLICGQISVTVD